MTCCRLLTLTVRVMPGAIECNERRVIKFFGTFQEHGLLCFPAALHSAVKYFFDYFSPEYTQSGDRFVVCSTYNVSWKITAVLAQTSCV